LVYLAVGIGFPELVHPAGERIVVHEVAMDDAEKIGVVVVELSSACPGLCAQGNERKANG
jgi:hypothetical protein